MRRGSKVLGFGTGLERWAEKGGRVNIGLVAGDGEWIDRAHKAGQDSEEGGRWSRCAGYG